MKIVRILAAVLLTLLPLNNSHAYECSRIITLAPSITESVFAIGLGANLVGVSTYSNYPEQAKQIKVVGALFDPNIELIVSLKPSIVLLPQELKHVASRLESLDIESILLDYNSVRSILDSIELIGTSCNAKAQALDVTNTIRSELKSITERSAKLPKVKSLVVVAESSDDGSLQSFYASGRDGFYSELLELVGGENVYPGLTGALGRISREGLLALDPEAIIKIMPDASLESRGKNFSRNPSTDTSLGELGVLSSLKAAKNGRISVLKQDFMFVPGPRLAKAATALARAIHPEFEP